MTELRHHIRRQNLKVFSFVSSLFNETEKLTMRHPSTKLYRFQRSEPSHATYHSLMSLLAVIYLRSAQFSSGSCVKLHGKIYWPGPSFLVGFVRFIADRLPLDFSTRWRFDWISQLFSVSLKIFLSISVEYSIERIHVVRLGVDKEMFENWAIYSYIQ